MNSSRCWCFLGLSSIASLMRVYCAEKPSLSDADELFIHRPQSFPISIFLFQDLLSLSFH
jgi:hypothetical protein